MSFNGFVLGNNGLLIKIILHLQTINSITTTAIIIFLQLNDFCFFFLLCSGCQWVDFKIKLCKFMKNNRIILHSLIRHSIQFFWIVKLELDSVISVNFQFSQFKYKKRDEQVNNNNNIKYQQWINNKGKNEWNIGKCAGLFFWNNIPVLKKILIINRGINTAYKT